MRHLLNLPRRHKLIQFVLDVEVCFVHFCSVRLYLFVSLYLNFYFAIAGLGSCHMINISYLHNILPQNIYFVLAMQRLNTFSGKSEYSFTVKI